MTETYTDEEITEATNTTVALSDAELLQDYEALGEIKNFTYPEGMPEFIVELLKEENEIYLGLWEPIVTAEVQKRGLA